MKLTLYSRFLGLGLALLASAAMAQVPTPPITSLSTTNGLGTSNNIQWFNYNNWSNGFVNGAGSVAWLNQPLSINPTISDFTQGGGNSVVGTTAAIPLTGGIPTNNSLTVTDGTSIWSQSKGSSSPTAFNVIYDPSTNPPSIQVFDNTAGRTLYISYSTGSVTPGQTDELIGRTDGIQTVFTKTLSADPKFILNGTHNLAVSDSVYNWTADGTFTNGMANGQSLNGNDPTNDFTVQYVVATRQMTVTYTAQGLATAGAGKDIHATYTPANPGALGVTLGTLGIGNQSGSNTVSLRLNSLTMNNNGAMAQINKNIGATGDEIASGIHLVNPLGLAVRTGGDFTSSLRLSGNVDGPSGIVKMDSGNVTFTGNNTFTGPTIVRDTGGTVYLRSGLMLYNCTTTLGLNTVTCQSVSGLAVGMSVSGTTATANFIQPGAVVTSISLPVAPFFISSFTMNLVATGTATSQTLTAKSTTGVTLAGCKAAAGSTTVTAASTAGLAVGMSLTGTSMPTSAVVMGISGDGVTFSINHATPATTTAAAGETIIATQVPRLNLTQTLTNATTNGTTTITLVPLPAGAGASTTAGLVVGASVTGPGIPSGASIASITNSTQFVITAPATAAVGSTLKIGSATTAASTTIACANTAGLSPGMTVTGVNMPSGAVVLSVTDATHFVINSATALSGAALTLIAQAPPGLAITNCVMDPGTGQAFTGCATTAGSTTVTTASTVGLVAGMTLTGPNLPVSAVVNSITNGTSFVISNVATGTGTGLTLVARSVPSFNLSLNLTSGSTLNGSPFVTCASTAGLVAGAAISGPNIPVGATISGPPSGNSFTISAPATATGSGLTFVVGGTTTATSSTVACASTAGLVAGMAVTGPNIPSGATVGQNPTTNPTTFTISPQVVIGAVGQPLTAQSVSNIDVITCTSTASLAVGMAVNGPNMPSGAFITAINSPTSFSINTEPLRSASGVMLFATSGGDVTLTNVATTSGTTTVTCDSTLGLVVGMAVTGTNIQSSATVATITDATHFTLSLPATATATGLTLAGGTYALSSSQIFLGTANRDGNTTVVLQLAASNQINDTSVIYFDGASSRNPYLRTEGFSTTIGGILDDTQNGVIENTESENGVYRGSVLTVNNSSDFSYSGFFRNKSGGDSTGLLGLTKGGTGVLSLSGANVNFTGDSTVIAGTLRIYNTTNWASNITTRAAANLELATIASDWGFNSQLVGGGGVVKTGPNVVTLTQDETYTGATTITGGGTLGLTSGFNQAVGTNGATSYTITLLRMPYPGTMFISDGTLGTTGTSTLAEPAAGFGVSTYSGTPGGTGIISGAIYNPATKVLTIKYSSAPPSGASLRVGYQPADNQRIGNTNSADRSFSATLISAPGGTSLLVTDGVDTWSQANAANNAGSFTGTSGPGGLFSVTYDSSTRLVAVTYGSTPAYGKAITALWTAGSGLLATSAINLVNGNLIINNSPNPQITGGLQLNSTDRVNNNATINSTGGTISFNNGGPGPGGGIDYTESLGTLNLTNGYTTINTQPGGGGSTGTLTFKSLVRADAAGSSLLFSGPNLGRTNFDQQLFTQQPTLGTSAGHLIGGWAVVLDGPNYDFATYGANGVTSLTTSNARTVGIASWSASVDAVIKANQVSTKDTTVNSLEFNDPTARTLSLGTLAAPRKLTINSGGMIFEGATVPIISAFGTITGSLTPGGLTGNELDLWTTALTMSVQMGAVLANGTADISTVNSGMVVVKNGLGEVKLTASNTYTGGTRVYGGDLDVASITSLGQVPGASHGAPTPKADFLTLSGGTIQLSATLVAGVPNSPILTFDTYHGIVLGPASGTFALDPTSTVNIDAPITGPGGLGVGSKTIFSSGGIINLAGTNTFQGTVTATSGTISFNGGSNSFTGGFSVGTSGTIIVHDSTSIPANEVVTMAGGFFNLGSSLTIGALTATVGSTISLQPDASQGALPGKTTVLNPHQPILLTINQLTNTTFAGTITDTVLQPDGVTLSPVTLGIEKKGAGVLTLTQSLGDILSDYRGVTKISEGVLATSLLGFRGQASAIGSGGGIGFGSGDLARSVGSASLLYIENGAGLSYVGTNPVSSNRPFTIGVGALGAGYYANGVGLGNTVSLVQGRLFTVDPLSSAVTDLGPDSIGFSKPNQPATLVLGGRNLGDNTFGMDLHDNGRAPLSLQKSGDGNWVMGLALGPNVTLTHCTTNVASLPTSSDPSYVVNCDSTAGLVVGMTVTGTGILEGTTVFQINSTSPPSFVLSQQAAPLTLQATNGGAPLTLTHSTYNYDLTGTTLTMVTCDFVAGMQVGMTVSGPGIPSLTTVSAFTSDTANTQLTLTLSQAAIPVTVSMPVIGDSFSDFTGGTTIYLGTLAVQQNGALGAAGGGPVQLIGGNLDLRNVAYTRSKTLALDGGRLRSIIGSSSWAGPVVADVPSTIEVDTGSLLDLQGGISGRAGITKVGLGTLSLDGQNTFIGGMNVNEGGLQLDYTHNNGSKLADGATLTLGGGRSGATVNLLSSVGAPPGNVEVVNTLSLGFGLNRITGTPGGTSLRVNAISIAQGATLDVQTFSSTTSAASSTRPNEANSGIIGTWATVTSGNVSDWARNPNSTSPTSTTLGPIVAYVGYSNDTWAGIGSNVNVTTSSSPPAGSTTNTLRYATNVATTLTLTGTNYLNDSGILQSASAGAVNNIITGGTLVLGNNAQGGNLVLQQYDALGGLQINSAITNALDIPSASITYSSAVTNRINLGVGLNTSTFYTGMVVTGPNIRPGSILNGITNSTAYTISQNIASPLTFTQNGAATTPPPSTYTVTTQADGVPNEIRLSAPPLYQLVVGELVTDTGGYIPPGTVITAVLNPTAGVNATDYLVSNPLPAAASGVTVNVNLWGELAVGNVFVMAPSTFSFTAQTAQPNEIVLSSTPAVPLVVGEQVNDAVANGGQGLIPPGTTVSTVVSPTDYLLSNNLTGTTSADTLTRSTMAYQVHLSVGGTSGIITGSSGGTAQSIAVGQTVSGLGIPAGATVIGLVPGSTTDFYFTFNPTRNLIIGGNSSYVGNIAAPSSNTANGGLLIHLTNPGGNTGIVAGQLVSGTDIQPGSFVSSTVAGGTDILLTISVFSPVVNVTVSGHNGLLKAGPGNAQLGGVNTFTGPVTISGGALSVSQVTNGGVPGTLGASSSAAANITIGGGTLRYTGDSATVDRGFTINSQGAIDVANKGVTLNFTGNLSGGTGAALGILQKTGSGTLALSRSVTTGGATNFGGFEVDGGALQLVYIDPNDPAASATTPVSDKFAASANNATLTLGGGKFELVGVATAPVLSGTDFTEDRVQNLLGQFTLNTGASQVWVTSALGSNTTLNLQNGLAPTDVARKPGGTVLFVENPNGGASASITLAVNSIDQATVLPWATYLDTSFVSQPGVNNFASLEPADDGVISADSKRLYTTTSDVSAWGSGQTVSESGTAFSGFTPTPLAGPMEIYAMRFFAQSAGVVNITDNLLLAGGAILAGTNSGKNSKIIQGGLITSGLNDPGTQQNDFIIHNYNPVSPLQIASQIADDIFVSPHVMVNLVHTGTGTTILYGNNSPLITDPFSKLGNVGDPNPLYGTNTYSGTTYLTGGILRLGTLPTVGTVSATPGAALPGGILASASGVAGAGNLDFQGGVLGISSSFTRILGTGLGQVQFTGSGGFAAYVADATVNFGGTLVPTSVVWGANGFVPDSSELVLSSADATNTITIANPINLGGFARTVNVADGAAAVDAIFSGGLSGNGGSIRKTGSGTLRLTGGSGTQTGGAVLGQGTLSTSANALGTGPLGIGNTDLTTANDALVLELRGGTFNSSITVGNKNSAGITTISATSSPTLNGPMVLGRSIFFGPQAGRKITISGGITGTGGFTVVDGGVVALNGPATFPGTPSTPGTTQGPAIDGAAVVRAGALYLGNSTALGNANVELGDTATTAPFSVDRTSAGRSLLLQGGSYDPRSSGRPATSNGRGGFIFPSSTVLIDGRTYTEADSMLDGVLTTGDLFHKRTLILVNGESSSPDRNGIYELVFAHGDSFNLSGCATSLNPAITLVNIPIARSHVTITTAPGGTRNLIVGMTVTNPTLLAPGSKVQSIIDDSTFVLSLAPVGTGTGNLVFTIGSNTVTCTDQNFGQLAIGMPVSGPNIPLGTSVTGVFPSVTDPGTGLPTTASFTISAPAIAASSSPETLTFRFGDTIGLNRIDEFNQDFEMTYGTRVFVKNDGTGASDAGKTFFLAADVHVTFGAVTLTNAATVVGTNSVTCASTAGLAIGMQVADSGTDPGANVDLAANATITGIVGDNRTFIVNLPSQLTATGLTLIATVNPPIPQFSPTWWKVDTLDPNVGLLAATSGLTIGNSIDINGPTGFGVTSLGGAASFSSGSSAFNGNVVLQNAARLITNAATLPGSTTVNCDNTGSLLVGMAITGTNIPANATVVSITSPTAFVISAPATVKATVSSLTATLNHTLRLLSNTLDPGGVVFNGIFSEANSTGDLLSLQKLGTGVVTLNGANTYQGGTSVLSGSLMVDNSIGSGTGTGAVTVSNLGSVLGGNGTISGPTTLSGGAILSPGDPKYGGTGNLNFNSDLTLGLGAAVNFDLGSQGSSADFDRINVLGQFRVDPTVAFDVQLNFVLPDPNAIGASDLSYTVLSWTPGSLFASGNLSSQLDLPSLLSGYYWDTSLFNSTGTIIIKLRQPGAPPVARFAVSSAHVTEGEMSVKVAVELDTPVPSNSSGIIVPLVLGGTATQGLDYDVVLPSVAFTAGSTSADVTIQVHENALAQPTRTVVLTLGTPSPAGTLLTGSPASFTLSIEDNDSSVPLGTHWKVRNPLPTNETLLGVTPFGSNIFAVGTSGTLLTSTDGGTTWSRVPLGISPAFRAIASTPNITPAASPPVPMIVLVGDDGNIVTSPDGVVWTYRNASGAKALQSVIWVDALSLFVAVGQGGLIFTSADGATWTHQNSTISSDLESVAYGDATLIAVGKDGVIVTSTDVQAAAWAQATSNTNRWLRSVAFNAPAGKFAAIGDGGALVTSPDGSSWTTGSILSTTANLRSIYSDGARFIVAGVGGVVFYSADGSTWNIPTPFGVTADLQAGVSLGGNASILVGSSGTIVKTITGTTFAKSTASSGSIDDLQAITYNGTQFIAVGKNGRIVTSAATTTPTVNPAGNVWTVQNSTTGVRLASVAYKPGQILAVGDNGTVVASANGGTTWTASSAAVAVNLHDVIYTNGAYYAVGDADLVQGTILKNVTGTTWTPLTSNTAENLQGIASNGSLMVVVGDVGANGGTILTSSDGGDTWEDNTPGGLPALKAITWTGSQFIIVGAAGTVLTTPDGINLTPQNTSVTADLSGVTWTGTTALVVGAHGTALSSPDGLSWTVLDAGTSQDLTAVAYNSTGTRLAMVGAAGSILTSDPVIIPAPSVYFASSTMTVDDLIGTANVPITVSGIPSTDLHITFTIVPAIGVPSTAYSAVSPFVIKAAGITQTEISAGIFTRYLPIKLVSNAIKTAGSLTITMTALGAADNAGLFAPTVCVLHVTPAVAPTITLNPATQNQMVALGSAFSLTANVTGSTPVTQWLKAGVLLAGATSPVYHVAAATTANAGKYTAKATNVVGTSLTTTGQTAPAGTAEISVVDQTDRIVLVKNLASTTFTAVAAGDGLTYAWFKVGTGLLATNTKYTVAGPKLTVKIITSADEGTFYCTVSQTTTTNTGLTANTGNFNLYVAAVPDIVVPASTPVGRVGATYSLPVTRASSDPHMTPVTYTASGLPTGLTINATTGVIGGIPTVAGSFSLVKVTATNAAGPRLVGPFTIVIDPIDAGALGAFVGLVDRTGAPTPGSTVAAVNGTLGLGARFDLTTLANSSYTGKLTVGLTAYTFLGKLVTSAVADPSPHNPQGHVTILRAGKSTLTVAFNLDPATNLLSGTVTDGSTSAAITGWRNEWKTLAASPNPAPVAGLHNFIADVPGGPPTNGSQPEGSSYGGLTIVAAGTTTIVGKTADGYALATSGVMGPSGQVLVYQSLYVLPGTFSGIITIDVGTSLTSTRVQQATGSLTWSHPAQTATTNRTFKNGWLQPINLGVDGGLYYPASFGAIVMSLQDNTGTLDLTNAQLNFTGGNVTDTGISPSLNATTNKLFQVKAPATPVIPANATSTTLTINNTTGAFSGSFTLTDPDPTSPLPPALPKPAVVRKVLFQGIIIPNILTTDTISDGVGYGYFLLPERPQNTVLPATTPTTSPILSGLVIFESK